MVDASHIYYQSNHQCDELSWWIRIKECTKCVTSWVNIKCPTNSTPNGYFKYLISIATLNSKTKHVKRVTCARWRLPCTTRTEIYSCENTNELVVPPRRKTCHHTPDTCIVLLIRKGCYRCVIIVLAWCYHGVVMVLSLFYNCNIFVF